MKISYPAFQDMLQDKKKLKIPEIRVWCHPGGQDDCYYIFNSFEDAFKFIKWNPKITEGNPLIAFDGYEINLFDNCFNKKLKEKRRK